MGRRMSSGGDAAGRPESVVSLAQALPQPALPIATTPVLILAEEEMLAKCEAAVDSLALAFWLAGKALHVIRDGRLYRGTHGTFEEYTLDRWKMGKAQANKLIRTWRIAEAVFEKSNTLAPIGAKARKELNQAMAWELVPVAEKHGVAAAGQVFTTVVEVDGEPTAATIKRVVKVLPSDSFEPKAVKAAIEGELSRELQAVPMKARLPKARHEQQAGVPTAPWGDPAAVYRLLREHMTTEHRSALVEMLIADEAPATVETAVV
jgi:hypothetical protein